MPVRDAIANIRRDPRWPSKIGIGALVNLVPYVGVFALMGWLIDYERAVAWGTADRLPEWGDWGERAKNGLFGMLPGFAYVYAVSMIAAVPLMGFIVYRVMRVAISAASAAQTGAVDPRTFGLALIAPIWLATMAWAVCLSALMLPFTHVPLTRYALWRDLKVAFQFKATWRQIRAGGKRFRRAWGFGALYVLIVMVLTGVAFLPVVTLQFALAAGGSGTPGFPLVFAALAFGLALYAILIAVGPAASVVQIHLWGEWAREAYDLENVPRARAVATTPATATTGQTPEA